MTTKEAILAMRIGCKIRSDWMREGLYYYIQGNAVHSSDDWAHFMSITRFGQSFDDSHNWYIV